MKTITIKVKNDKDAELLKNLLKSAKFEAQIETFEEDEELSDSEFQILEERWEKYKKNPSSVTSLDDFKKELKDKHGL